MTNEVLSTIARTVLSSTSGVEVSARWIGPEVLILLQWCDEDQDPDRVLSEIFPLTFAPANVREPVLSFLFRCGTEANPWEGGPLFTGPDGQEWWFMGEAE